MVPATATDKGSQSYHQSDQSDQSDQPSPLVQTVARVPLTESNQPGDLRVTGTNFHPGAQQEPHVPQTVVQAVINKMPLGGMFAGTKIARQAAAEKEHGAERQPAEMSKQSGPGEQKE